MPTSLEGLINPHAVDDFLTSVWDKTFCYLPGCPGKYKDLFSWNELNRVLEEHRLPAPRLQLFRNGRAIDPAKYQTRPEGILHPCGLLTELRNGATLIINHVQEASRPVRDLTRSLEDTIGSRVHVNLYAAWGKDVGFSRHVDPQDTFVLQVSGTKRWQIWEPTRRHPLQMEMVPDPATDPVWDDVLGDGSALYMPRGWWHVAVPLGQPCLHLTVSIPNLKGIDFLHWFADELRSEACVRKNIPWPTSESSRQGFCNDLYQTLEPIRSGDLLDRFAQSARSRLPVWRELHFPSLSDD
jgi:hypothetical protein